MASCIIEWKEWNSNQALPEVCRLKKHQKWHQEEITGEEEMIAIEDRGDKKYLISCQY